MTMHDCWSELTDHQASVARRFLAERERERKHLVIYLSGAHAYGFPSPDSDLDLKCVHIVRTRDLVDLNPSQGAADRTEVVDGVELDYGSNELADVLRGIVRGNGNYLERILGDLVLGSDATLLAQARDICVPLISRRLARHYAGFAMSQLRLFDDKPTAKRALYVLRTCATGRQLLAHGDVVTDVNHLAAFVPSEIADLLALKQKGERQSLDAAGVPQWRIRLVEAINAVEAAVETANIPPEPSAKAVAAANEWLLDVRRVNW